MHLGPGKICYQTLGFTGPCIKPGHSFLRIEPEPETEDKPCTQYMVSTYDTQTKENRRRSEYPPLSQSRSIYASCFQEVYQIRSAGTGFWPDQSCHQPPVS